MTNLHNNKTYLITGGTSGIGAATAALLAEQGAQVIVTGRNPETLSAARKNAPENVEVIESDASDIDAIDALVQQIQKKHGTLDGAFINAGVALFRPIDQWDVSSFERMFAINVKGPFFLTQKLIPLLGDSGSIVFNTSVVNDVGMDGAAAYGATKGALLSMLRSLSVELAGRGIRVNAVSPGPIDTPIYGKLGMPEEQLNGFASHMASRIPLARFGSGRDVAHAAAFLLSSHAGFITGEELRVDGGMRNNVA